VPAPANNVGGNGGDDGDGDSDDDYEDYDCPEDRLNAANHGINSRWCDNTNVLRLLEDFTIDEIACRLIGFKWVGEFENDADKHGIITNTFDPACCYVHYRVELVEGGNKLGRRIILQVRGDRGGRSQELPLRQRL
jgi:hypothetical protein